MPELFLDLSAALILGVLVGLGSSWILRLMVYQRLDQRNKIRLHEIEDLLRELRKLDAQGGTTDTDRQLMKLVLDYSMRATNVHTGLRLLTEVLQHAKSSEARKVIDRAREVLSERLKAGALQA